MKTIMIDGLELSTGQASALAQLIKRIGWREIRINAKNEAECYLMREALSQLQRTLADYGYAPR